MGEEGHEAEPLAQGGAHPLEILFRGAPGEARGGDGRHGHAEDADGELHQPEGVAQPGRRALHPRGEDGVDEEVHLGGGETDGGRPHQPRDAAQPRVGEVDHQAEAMAELAGRGNLHQELGRAAEEGEDRPADHRLLLAGPRPEEEGAAHDGHHVEEGRGEGRRAESLLRVELPHGHRGQRDEGQKGKHDPRAEDRDVSLSLDRPEARGHGVHDPGREEDPQQGEAADHHQDGADDQVGQADGPLPPLVLQGVGEGGDEGRGERSLREEIAEEVGDAEGDDEGVREGARAEEGREELLADEAEHAREHGRGGDEGRPGPHARGGARGDRSLVRLGHGGRMPKGRSPRHERASEPAPGL